MLSKLHSNYMKYAAPIAGVIPVALPASIAAFSVVAMFLLVISRLDNWLVWPLGLLAALATFVLVAIKFQVKRPGSLREQAICDLAVLGGAAGWAFINAHYSAQNVFVSRDPAIYTNAGAWLVRHDSLHIPVSHVFGQLSSNFNVASPGFGSDVLNPAYLYAQGLHLLPVWLGLAGRLAGEAFALHLNALFGAVALLALYAFARQLGRPRFALLITAVLAVSLPLIFFSRDTYTEPLAMMFTFGSLTLLWGAMKTRSYILWGAAGLMASSGVLTRTDGYLTIAALLFFVAAFLAVAEPRRRKQDLKRAAVFVGCAIPPALIGWFDLTHLSSGYYRDLRHDVHQEIALVLFAGLITVISVTLAWKTDTLRKVDEMTAAWRVNAIVVLALAIVAVMISRPLWYVGHEVSTPLVGGLQAQAGKPIDPTRSYAEQTVNWVGWYIGPLLEALGVTGLIIALWRIFKKAELLLLPGLLVVAITCLLFLNKPSITPDQLWASRRLLPVILPGIAAFGVIAMDWLYKKTGPKYRQVIWILVAEAIILLPLFISYPFLRLRSYTPALSQINSVCGSLPNNSAILWAGKMRLVAPETARSFCNVPSVGIKDVNKRDLHMIAQHLKDQNITPIIGMTAAEQPIYAPSYQFTPVSPIVFRTMEETLYHPPRHIATESRTIILGRVQPDGTIVPLRQDK